MGLLTFEDELSRRARKGGWEETRGEIGGNLGENKVVQVQEENPCREKIPAGSRNTGGADKMNLKHVYKISYQGCCWLREKSTDSVKERPSFWRILAVRRRRAVAREDASG